MSTENPGDPDLPQRFPPEIERAITGDWNLQRAIWKRFPWKPLGECLWGVLPDDELRIDTFRAGATSSARITHLPTGLDVECDDLRLLNRDYNTAMRLLRIRLARSVHRYRQP